MARVIFYEKPGCKGGTRQKVLLTAAGHEVITYNLLTEPWTVERLRSFFGDRPVTDWFNRSAPQIKSGEIVPEQLDEQTALLLMLREPLLIRRPLLQVGDRREVGFDVEILETWIGLKPVDESFRAMSENLMSQDLQGCAHGNGHSHDHHHDHQGGCNHHGQQEHHRQSCHH
ncbi:Nitrogenase-associated protein [Trichormus variabilis ATCC 29413]|uniref:Nitrogenase-associated protein n=2 Tax=Anabaena variabilis TaxID=264691 RepID=Q3MG09_TRIV2|nr:MULTISPECIES: ArsC/Spx/MgsR family protein [Nostocaceae]ABA20077.1 Nitrogenase-associated protein [Trichormus variabilis ATCC 29413]MBC1214707.1 nitrogenase-associated protein [Trichormus variabilis ARAD]MBC1257016.1 nitrogenase-associated protein [Trichormus variabilis V5]MBC1269838.1 nitrogenase-associated protein [Trichormus variabilis FSR]MBC1303627.1 nitrogenase-associated protein [Trichormus variabilis N2B]